MNDLYQVVIIRHADGTVYQQFINMTHVFLVATSFAAGLLLKELISRIGE